jgi:hypothetical protein
MGIDHPFVSLVDLADRLPLESFHHDQQHHEWSLGHDGMVQVWRHVRKGQPSLLGYQLRGLGPLRLRGNRVMRASAQYAPKVHAEKTEQNHPDIVVVVECSTEDAALWHLNFFDQFGCDEIGRIQYGVASL